ncbi:VgrG-related protein [Streptomyces erythrochromogenes]|uniref:VgrG-related protein n=1 Tax=Streptomyces erythrochromogenes TaxID=285574 RepID=UPI003684A500
MTGRHTAGLDIKVEGDSLPPAIATALAWVSVEEDGHTSAAAEIGFRDPRNAALFKKSAIVLGSQIKLTAKTPSGWISLFCGEVTECEARASADTSGASGHTGGVMTVIRARDISHRLRQGRRTVAYEKMTAGEIVRKVADEAGVKSLVVDDREFSYEYLSQPAMSDWDFLSHLARENGRDLYVRKGELHFRKRENEKSKQPPVALRFGENLINVQLAASLAHQVPSVEVRGWDRQGKEAISSVCTPVPGGKWRLPPSSSQLAPMVLTGLPRRNGAEAKVVAESMAQEVAAGLHRLHAVVRGEPRLRLRSAVTLTGLGKPFEGHFTVTRVRHSFHPVQGYLTEMTVDEGTDRAVAGRPGDAEEGLRRVPGFVRGKVVDIKDPKKLGRVRVKLDCLDAKYVTTWAETVQLGGGRGHGVVLPEVNDVVAVVFEQGCLDSPLVVGGVDDPLDKVKHTTEPVDSSAGRTNLRTFASKKGHRVELIDENRTGMGATLVTGNGKLKILLDQYKTEISVDSAGKVEIRGAKGVSIDAGTGPLDLKGDSVKITATQGIKVNGQNVSLSGMTKLSARGGNSELALNVVNAKLQGPLVKIN